MMVSARQSAGEVGLIVGLVLLIVWVVKPLDMPVLDLSLRALVVVSMLASAWIHGDSRQRLGLRLDNLGASLVRVLPLSLLAAGLCVAAGLLFVICSIT
jgi:hypothetical protein